MRKTFTIVGVLVLLVFGITLYIAPASRTTPVAVLQTLGAALLFVLVVLRGLKAVYDWRTGRKEQDKAKPLIPSQPESERRNQLILLEVGKRYYQIGKNDQALNNYERALVIHREVGDRAMEGTTLNNIGAVYRAQGKNDQALNNYERALVIHREVGDRAGEGATLNNIGEVYRAQGKYDQALNNYEQALVIAREVGAKPLEEAVLRSIENLPDE